MLSISCSCHGYLLTFLVTAADHGGPTLDTDQMGSSSHPTADYQDDDIRIEYHPSSGLATRIIKLDEYRESAKGSHDSDVDPEPWAPFRTREDFEFAELMLEAGMTKAQVEQMIKLVHKCIEKGNGSFTISNHKDMSDMFDIASNRLTKVM